MRPIATAAGYDLNTYLRVRNCNLEDVNMAFGRQFSFVHFFLILAFFTAGISPACKFISGQQTNLIEICTTYGIKKIPTSDGDSLPSKGDHKGAEQCMFCISAHVNKVIADSAIEYNFTPDVTKTNFVVFKHRVLPSQAGTSFEARAPPTSS